MPLAVSQPDGFNSLQHSETTDQTPPSEITDQTPPSEASDQTPPSIASFLVPNINKKNSQPSDHSSRVAFSESNCQKKPGKIYSNKKICWNAKTNCWYQLYCVRFVNANLGDLHFFLVDMQYLVDFVT
jgi:hypothetical protein